MKYRKLTPDFDYKFGENLNNFLTDKDAVAQAIRTKLYLFYGEWWEQIDDGNLLVRDVLGQINSEVLKQTASSIIEETIMEVKDVISVSNIVVDYDRRSFKINAEVNTKYDSVLIEVRY